MNLGSSTRSDQPMLRRKNKRGKENKRHKTHDDAMVTFFDESHARAIGLRPNLLKAVFFVLLSASVVAAMQTVGAFLVIAMVVTPGATAYLLCDRFPWLLIVSVLIGALCSFFGAYLSFLSTVLRVASSCVL